MSTLTGRDQSALLAVDMQNDVVGSAWRRDEVVGRIGDLVGKARAVGARVVWVQHNEDEMPIGTPGWEIVDALSPVEGEARIDKAVWRLVR
jgi:nicotinamidase-related amidase